MKTRTGMNRLSGVERFMSVSLMVVISILLASVSANGADRLAVKNNAAETKFVVTEEGRVGIGTPVPELDFDFVGPSNGLLRLSNTEADNTTKGSRMVLRHYSNSQLPVYLFGAASTATANFVAFGGGSTIGNAATQIDLFTAENTTTAVGTPRVTIKNNGNVGIGTQNPNQPLQMASGAHVTAGGVWTDASSREYKENIEFLKTEDALTTLAKLDPVKFNYKADASERHLGFIAEDVPDLVATKDRKGLSPMDIVAVLTKVLQEQQNMVKGLKAENEAMRQRLFLLEEKVTAAK